MSAPDRVTALPDWVVKAAAKGELGEVLQARMSEELRRGISLGVGWTFGECCSTLDAGSDPRQSCQGMALDRAMENLLDG